MTLTILDPCTSKRTIVTVPTKPRSEQARRWVLRELDRIEGRH